MSTATPYDTFPRRAAVVTRQSQHGGRRYHPICIYLLSCAVDENGAAIIPALARNALCSARIVENERAARCLSQLVERAESLAQQVNAKELTFAQASFALEYGP